MKTTKVSATPNNGWEFKNWTENDKVISTEPEFTLEINKDTHLIANFQKKTYQVVLSSEGSGELSGDGGYLFGDSVTVTANPAENWKFIGWYDENSELVSSDQNYTFIIEDNKNLTAKFEEIFYNLKLEAKPEEGGTVTGGGMI